MWSVSPSFDMLPFGVTIGYCTAEVGNPEGNYELPCVITKFYLKIAPIKMKSFQLECNSLLRKLGPRR
jgi:hypothetical protein